MAVDFINRLQNTDDVLVYFNGMQTFLVDEYGKPMEQHLSVWIVDHPQEFQDALRRIYATGHDISSTGTQAASPFRSKPFGQAVVDRVYELNYIPAKLAKEVTPEDHYAIGLISTTNQDFLEPLGNLTYGEVYEGYLKQIKGLVDGGVDVIAIAGDDSEALAIAIKAIKNNHPNMPIIARNLYYAGKKGFRTLMGLDPKTAAAKLHEGGAEVIGFSCGSMTKSQNPADYYRAATALLKEIKQGTDRYLVALPNAGEARLIDGKTVHPATPELMANEVLNWIDAGARLVGGCCGTGLEHGKKIAAVIKKAKKL